MPTQIDALHALAQSGTEAKVKLAHNPAGLNQAAQAVGQTQSAMDNASNTAESQRVRLAANAKGGTADRADATAANLDKSLGKINGQAKEIKDAVTEAAVALNVAQKLNQTQLDSFVSQATSIMQAVAAIKSVDPQAAQALLATKLTELGRQFDIDVQANLKNINGTLAHIAASLTAGSKSGGSASGGGQAPPRAFNSAGGGG